MTRNAVSPPTPFPADRARPVIGHVRPQVDCGSRPAKAAVGDLLQVEADAFVDGHDLLWCMVRFRHDADTRWSELPMEHVGNDHWVGRIEISSLGRYRFSIRAGVDPFATWARDLRARLDDGQEIGAELLIGASLLDAAAPRAKGTDRKLLAMLAGLLRDSPRGLEGDAGELPAGWAGAATLAEVVFSTELGRLMARLGDPAHCTTSDVLAVVAEPEKARFSAWYEMFPRSASAGRVRHGTLADVRARLDYVEEMGFDVLYLPPIHPIGVTGRKGPEGTPSAGPRDQGSPWAIGGAAGGHCAVHPDLGSLDDFDHLVKDAAGRGIDIAIDIAFQASPDHPWVSEHPQWFRHRPDGTIRYAENPPKRYEDIYPLDFDTAEWQSLWGELLGVVHFWISHGVRVFRVDNPHTKPFAFWEWLLASVKRAHPDVLFLSEAFTRPRVMEQLAKIGFTQSYTYFTWRTTKWELETYMAELTRTEVADYFRPNFWPNTPDILTAELQNGGRAAFISRLVLAATLSASYGIYGPAFELQEHVPRDCGSEEYRRSEKYEVRSWDLASPESLAPLIALVNRARREHVALQFNENLIFHSVDNEQLIAYSKWRAVPEGHDAVVTVVNLDHRYAQSGWVELDLEAIGVDPGRSYVMHDLLTDAYFVWEGRRNFVKLDPAGVPCHLFSVEQPRQTVSAP